MALLGPRWRLRHRIQEARSAAGAAVGEKPSLLGTTRSYQATGERRNVSVGFGHAAMQAIEGYGGADPTDTLDALDAIMPPSRRRGLTRSMFGIRVYAVHGIYTVIS